MTDETERAIAEDIEWLRLRDEELADRLVRVTRGLIEADRGLSARITGLEDLFLDRIHRGDGGVVKLDAPPRVDKAQAVPRWKRLARALGRK